MFGGVPRAALAKARATDRLVMSQPVFDEISDVLHRPGLARYFNPVLRDDLLDQLLTTAEWFVPGRRHRLPGSQ
jgi:hypothetical protein